MENSGFRIIIVPIIASLNNVFFYKFGNRMRWCFAGCFQNTPDNQRRDQSKIVSVNMDCATRLNHSIYGITLQASYFLLFHILSYLLSFCYRNWKIIIRTIVIVLVLILSQFYLTT
jgi:hypothetical protein